MNRFMIALFGLFFCVTALADTSSSDTSRYSIFSTSTDWQGVTGLQYNEYNVKFRRDRELIGNRGLILYYLDGFPCYGLGFGVRVWLGPNGQSDGDTVSLACVYPPTTLNFAYRNAIRDADQAATTGILTCPATGDMELTVDLSKCAKGPDWNKMK